MTRPTRSSVLDKVHTAHGSHSNYWQSKMNLAFHYILLTLMLFNQKLLSSEVVEKSGHPQEQTLNRKSTEKVDQGECFSDKGPCKLSPRFSIIFIFKSSKYASKLDNVHLCKIQI